MTRKTICLIVLAAILGGWYIIRFTDWFRHKSIRIQHTVRVLPEPGRAYGRDRTSDKPVQNVSFSFGKQYRLTSVKVFAAAEVRTNEHALRLWELTAPQGSQPVDGIAYGIPVPGMVPSPPDAEAEPLVPGVQYRLIVAAGSVQGTNDFSVPGRSASRRGP